jgi:hypothetical protein
MNASVRASCPTYRRFAFISWATIFINRAGKVSGYSADVGGNAGNTTENSNEECEIFVRVHGR